MESKNKSLSLPVEQTYQNLFNELVKLEEGDIICKTNCKFCVHPLRAEGEERFERANRSSYLPVERLFREYEKQHPEIEKTSYQAIRNHLLKHYIQQEKQLYQREYSERILALMNYKMNQDKQFEMLQAVMQEKLLEIAANPNLDPIKQADAMTKLSKMWIEVTEIQAKLRGDLKTVNLVTDKFMNVWLHIISTQKNENVKKELMEALDSFQENIQTLEFEENQ